ILDANVLISGIGSLSTSSGVMPTLIHAWFNDEFEVVITSEIKREVGDAWTKRYWQNRLPPGFVRAAIQTIDTLALTVEVSGLVSGEAPHWQDDHILEAALVGECDYIVTGDTELQHLGAFQGIRIVSPTGFLTAITPVGQ
ncbi:MAG TPA: PIN domain-containing protein, partial [Thermomicrobiales bacterium]|nr:PIN domain-containing protein [Thermomicrobiales bacterium]